MATWFYAHFTDVTAPLAATQYNYNMAVTTVVDRVTSLSPRGNASVDGDAN